MHSHTEDVLNHISTLARHLNGFSSKYAILVILMELEFNEKHDGFEYLRTAIHLFCEEPFQMITKGLYPAVAKQYGRGVSAGMVEKSIRDAICKAWKNRGKLWCVYFPSDEKPSNGEFIAKVSKYIELWKECCKVYDQQSVKEESRHG